MSAATRRRLLAELLRRAEAGDETAATALIKLSLENARGGAKPTGGEG